MWRRQCYGGGRDARLFRQTTSESDGRKSRHARSVLSISIIVLVSFSLSLLFFFLNQRCLLETIVSEFIGRKCRPPRDIVARNKRSARRARTYARTAGLRLSFTERAIKFASRDFIAGSNDPVTSASYNTPRCCRSYVCMDACGQPVRRRAELAGNARRFSIV